ncbi:MAG: acyl-CoA dehydrogenase domain-containing protein [Anaerolineaceae bacterium]|nr:MAG: acyl-CoA dehydrogenase domain-containing protein [Anaerolineaceae bacterium]
MYSFEPSDEQKMLVDAARRYATADLRAAAHDAEESKELPPKLISKGWELGVLQASIPETYGGFGERSAVTGALAAEELACGDLAGALAVGTPGLFAIPILLAGSEEQKKQHLPPVIAADWKPYTAALIEPAFDFDPNDLKTTAKAEGGDYVLTGEKTLVPFAAQAEAMIVFAALKKETRAFIVPKGAAGLTVQEEREKWMGLNALPFHRVKLDGVKVPKSNLLPGNFAPVLDASRVAVAAMAVGVARAAFDYARDYAKDRDVFGVKVAQKQAIAFMLAEMATEIEAIRLLVWEAGWAIDNKKEDAGQKAYIAATGAIDTVMMVTDRAVQILGGHGYIREHPVELFMRNGRGFAMFTGLAMV